MLGYDSGEKMLMDMAGARNRNQLIQAETDRRMHEAHGDLLTDGSIHEEAKRAVQNELRGKVVEAEIRALNRKAKEVKPYVDAAKKGEQERAKAGQEIYRAIVPTQKQARIQAERIIAGKRIREIRPLQYFAAAKNASKAALEAMRKGDYLIAGHQKSRELLSMELYRAALETVDQTQKDVDKLKKTFRADTKQAATKNIDMVNAARAILAAHGIGNADKPPASYLESMRKYDPEMYENMRDRVDAAVADQKNYRDMTVEEFIGMRDAVLALVFTASRSKQIEVDGKLMDRKEVVAQLVARIQTFGVKEKAGYKQAMTKWDQTKAGLLSVRAYLRRVELWVEAMDGGDPNGVFRRYVWNPMQDALNKYRESKKDFLHRYLELVKGVEKGLGTGRIDAREIGYTFGKGTPTGKVELLHALLHTGNESNLSKLLRGRGWGEYREDGSLDTSRWDAFIARMIRDGVLTKADYDFAQGVWDMLEELKPMAQKAHHQMYGFYFDEVTANPIDTPFGVYRGGYMPAVVDPNIVADAAIRKDRDELMHGQNSFAFPTTGRGFTMKRMEKYAKPLQLDMRTIPAHIDWVLRFVHLETAGKDVGRVLINTDLREALDNIDPAAARHMLMPWIQRTVKQIVSHPGDLQWVDRMSRELRRRVGMQFMVANVINTMQQFTGLSMALTKASGKNMRTAFWQYIRHPQQTAEMISERSVFMRNRIFTQHQEIMQHIDELLLNPTKYEKARAFADKHGYFLQQGTQRIVDKITWTAAYNDAIEQGMSDEGETSEAVRHADAVVRMTQGSFAPEDISRIEAGTPVARVFLMFYNYFNMQANLMGTEFANIATNKLGLKKGAGRALYIYIFAFMIPAFIG
ncbi:MAG: hypothetical protein NUV34_04300, partial [Sulfuricaulis sp.]|nr:hypothetical protein [Sulfuricaulis sp.]